MQPAAELATVCIRNSRDNSFISAPSQLATARLRETIRRTLTYSIPQLVTYVELTLAAKKLQICNLAISRRYTNFSIKHAVNLTQTHKLLPIHATKPAPSKSSKITDLIHNYSPINTNKM
jgi:hypothetical protein